jgi:hypothetical protein
VNALRAAALAVLVLCAGAPLAAADQTVYADARGAGWDDWSWASVAFANGSPVHSGAASIAVSAGAYQALYLHHAAQDASAFTALTFWIHGGATGGQHLRVQATRSGAAQTGVALATLAANVWTQVTLTTSQLGIAGAVDFDGFWIQETSGATAPAFYVDDVALLSVPPPALAHLAVDAGHPVRTVDARLFALNAAAWDAPFATPGTAALLAEIDNRALRFPGGSLSDEYDWVTNMSGGNAWTWATSFDAFSSIATQTNAQVFVTVNYGTGTPAQAAAWVTYANVTKSLGFRYWEVGNECYGSWETDANTRAHDPVTYANRFAAYAAQMKAADPTIKVGAVVVPGEDSYANYGDETATNPRTSQQHHGWTPVMLARLSQLGVAPDFVIHHRYAQEPGNESDAGLLAGSGTWANDAADLRQQLADYLGSAGAGVELVCTENNSVTFNPGKQTTSLVNGLFLADSLGHALLTEFAAVVWWDLRNGTLSGNNNSPSLYGWRMYGDYGVVDPFANPPSAAQRYPVFYVMKLLKSFARGGDTVVSATSDWSGLSVFSALRLDGTLTLLVVNKSPTAAQDAEIALTGWVPSGAATVRSYGIPQDEAARLGTGSADVAQAAAAASRTFTRSFPPYSATVVTLPGSRPGDANADGRVDVADVFYLVNALFAGGPAAAAGADANADGKIDVADVFYLINALFAGGPAPH